jgi:beta-glucanase (GH16 family)
MSADHVKDAGVTASEMDTMESQGNTPGSYWATLHSSTGSGGDQINQNHEVATGETLSNDFHTFGALWDPNSDHITYYLDGKAMIDAPKWASTDGAKMFVALSDMVGGWGGNAADASTPDPNHMLVDYVRVWQFADQHPQAVATDVPPPVVAPAVVEPPVVEPAVVAPPVDATPTVPPVPQVEATPTPIDYTYYVGSGGA